MPCCGRMGTTSPLNANAPAGTVGAGWGGVSPAQSTKPSSCELDFVLSGVWRCPTFTWRMPHYHRR